MVQIETMLPQHWEAVKTIYEEGIDTGQATFQTEAPSWEVWDNGHVKSCRLVAIKKGNVLGWSAMSPVSSRCVYAGVAEVSVYIAAGARGKKLGYQLLQALVKASEAAGFWTLQSGVFPENKASIAIHEKCGFRIVGFKEKIGKMGNAWRDTVFLERRSQIVGIE